MIYLKLIVGFLIVFACTVLGRLKANGLKQKRDFFSYLEDFFIYLKREISFSSASVYEAVRAYSCPLEDLTLMLKSFLDGELCVPSYLSSNERDFICKFFKKIGRSDKNNELELISFYIEEIGKMKMAENFKHSKFSRIYVKIGFFVGMIVFVVVL